MKQKKKRTHIPNPNGAPKKWEYKGQKRNFTIRLAEEEIEKIKKDHKSVQAFVQKHINELD